MYCASDSVVPSNHRRGPQPTRLILLRDGSRHGPPRRLLMLRSSSIPLPRGWPRHVRSAVVHAVSIARVSLSVVHSGSEHRFDARVRLPAENARVAVPRENSTSDAARLLPPPPHVNENLERPRHDPRGVRAFIPVWLSQRALREAESDPPIDPASRRRRRERGQVFDVGFARVRAGARGRL
jgi:hypothetical protein